MTTATERIQQQVGELGEWFHNFDLAGVKTAPNHQLGDYPQSKWRHISPALPERMEGLSILDIGCNAAFHALECKRRGASYVLGIDADARYLAQARLAAEVLNLEIDLRLMSVYALGDLDQQFDYVLFMGVFYHLRYPLYALDLAVKKVRQRLIFQTMLRGEAAADAEVKPDYSFWDQTPFEQAGFPLMYFFERSFAGDATNWWIPNRAAAEAMLRTAGLEIVAHPEAETWICAPRPAPEGFVHDRELAASL